MQNDPQSDKKRRPHPLEQQPVPPSSQPDGPDGEDGGSRITLHIPVVQPFATYTLIAINVVVFVLAFILMDSDQANELYAWGASNKVAVLTFGEYHRLFTAMFLHGGLPHLLFNMYALWIIGQTVERFFGHWRFLLVYFLGGLGGSVLSVVMNPANVNSVGASGAVFAIFGAEMIFLYQHRKLLGAAAMMQLRQLAIIAGINFAYGILTTLNPGGISIDNWGHVGGFLGGMIMAWLIGPIFIVKRHPEHPAALISEDINPLEKRYQSALIYVSVLLGILIFAMFLFG